MPAAPLVGAVTTRPPRVLLVDGQRHQVHPVLCELGITVRVLGVQPLVPAAGAPPHLQTSGRYPSRLIPRCSHSSITSRMCRSLARTSSAGRRPTFELAITSLIATPRARPSSSSSRAEPNDTSVAERSVRAGGAGSSRRARRIRRPPKSRSPSRWWHPYRKSACGVDAVGVTVRARSPDAARCRIRSRWIAVVPPRWMTP